MKRKYYTWLILLLSATVTQATPSLKDSLQKLLQETKAPIKRVDLLINILDLSDSSPDEPEIARELYTEGKKTDDKMAYRSISQYAHNSLYAEYRETRFAFSPAERSGTTFEKFNRRRACHLL